MKDNGEPKGTESKSLSRMIVVGGMWLGGSRAIRTLSSLLGMIVLARLLTPADFGVIAVVASVAALSLLMLEGLIDYPLSSLANLHVDAIRSVLWVGLGAVALLSAGVLLVAPLIERAIDFKDLAASLRATIPVYLSQVLFVSSAALLKRRKRFADIAIASSLSAFTYLFVAVTLAFWGFGLWSVIAAQLASSLLAAAIVVRRSQLPLGFPKQWTFAPITSTGLYGLAARVLTWFWSNADTYAVGSALGAAATGIYSRGYNLCVQVKEPFQALNEPLRQAFVTIHGKQGQLATSVLQGLRLATLLSALIASGCIVMRDVIVLTLLGSQWLSAVPVFAILVAGLPARVALNMLENVDLSVGRPRMMLVRHVLLAIIVGGGVFVVAENGIVAVASLVTGGLYLALLLPRSARRQTTGTGQLLGAMFPGMALAIAIALLCEFALRPSLSSVIADVFAVGVFYMLVVVAVAALVPATWLPASIQEKRRRLLARMPLRKG